MHVCVHVTVSLPPLSTQGETLETVTTACVCLFTHQTTLADQVPPLGHIPRILGRMKATNDIIPRSCALVIHVLADSDVSCVCECMFQFVFSLCSVCVCVSYCNCCGEWVLIDYRNVIMMSRAIE